MLQHRKHLGQCGNFSDLAEFNTTSSRSEENEYTGSRRLGASQQCDLEIDAGKDLIMRAHWKRSLRTLVVASTFTACTIVCEYSQAQFREITPNQPKNVIDEDALEPTRQPFVPPRPEPEPADSLEEPVKLDPTSMGEPTPAMPREETPTAQPEAAVSPAKASGSEEVKPVAKSSAKPTELTDTPKTTSKTIPQDSPETVVETEQVTLENLDPFSLFARPESTEEAPSPADGTSYPMVFNGVQPGALRISDVRELWGVPAKIVETDGAEKLIYKAPGFRQVDILADGTHPDDSMLTVHSVLVHLEQPEDAIRLSEQLGLDDVIPTIVEDESGNALGVAFPERGVLFGLDENHESVTTISMEQINGELFRLRAENDELNNYTQSIADLDMALRLNDQDAHAYWLQAELYSQIGSPDKAYEAAVSAVNRSDEPLYQLTRARLLAEQGNHQRATREVAAIANNESVPDIVRARAYYILGNLKATGSNANYEQSLSAHLKAIDLAARDLNTPKVKVRRMSKDILVDSHLAVAQDIALGNFQRQEEVVPKWLLRATELAENFLKNDRGEDTLRMEIYRATLAAYSVLPGNFDASIAAEEALSEGKRLLTESLDELYQRRVQRELVETLFYASRIEHQHGRFENAATYADNATSLIDLQDDSTSRFDRYVAGQLYFLKGSLHAIHQQDHTEAVEWYNKAKPILKDESLSSLVNRTAFGELFVSMGVSYWEVGQKEVAIELTNAGTQLLQAAVQEGTVNLDALSVPYGNLATMHASLGNENDAKHYHEMMAKIDKETTTR